MSNVQPLVAPNGIIRKEKKPYNEDESLNLLTTLAANLGINPKRHDFDESEFLPITYVPLESLYTDSTFQRLVDMPFIKGAKIFDAKLFTPVIVFERPNGKKTVGDGQHESIIGILYTRKGAKTKVPCYLHVHPSHYTNEQCVTSEAEYFANLNKRRKNVSALQSLRAGIAYGNPKDLETEDKLFDLGVHLEKIGDAEGPEVFGLSKLLLAYDEYGVQNTIKAIELYQRLQNDPEFDRWNDIDILQASLIGGFSAIFYLKEKALGKGDRNYALDCYLDEYLGNDSPKDFIKLTAGNTQAILIARRIVGECNTLIKHKKITKRNGERIRHHIKDGVMEKAGLGDPGSIA